MSRFTTTFLVALVVLACALPATSAARAGERRSLHAEPVPEAREVHVAWIEPIMLEVGALAEPTTDAPAADATAAAGGATTPDAAAGAAAAASAPEASAAAATTTDAATAAGGPAPTDKAITPASSAPPAGAASTAPATPSTPSGQAPNMAPQRPNMPNELEAIRAALAAAKRRQLAAEAGNSDFTGAWGRKQESVSAYKSAYFRHPFVHRALGPKPRHVRAAAPRPTNMEPFHNFFHAFYHPYIPTTAVIDAGREWHPALGGGEPAPLPEHYVPGCYYWHPGCLMVHPSASVLPAYYNAHAATVYGYFTGGDLLSVPDALFANQNAPLTPASPAAPGAPLAPGAPAASSVVLSASLRAPLGVPNRR